MGHWNNNSIPCHAIDGKYIFSFNNAEIQNANIFAGTLGDFLQRCGGLGILQQFARQFYCISQHKFVLQNTYVHSYVCVCVCLCMGLPATVFSVLCLYVWISPCVHIYDFFYWVKPTHTHTHLHMYV